MRLVAPKFLLLSFLFLTTASYSLESYTSFQSDHPGTVQKVQPVALVVKGSTDDEYYMLEADPTTGGIPVSQAEQQKNVVYTDRHDYSSGNVTTSGYTELIASTASDIYELYIFDSSGETLWLATGAAASETDLIYIPPGGNGKIDVYIASGTRLSVKAVSANATSGELVINATD